MYHGQKGGEVGAVRDSERVTVTFVVTDVLKVALSFSSLANRMQVTFGLQRGSIQRKKGSSKWTASRERACADGSLGNAFPTLESAWQLEPQQHGRTPRVTRTSSFTTRWMWEREKGGCLAQRHHRSQPLQTVARRGTLPASWCRSCGMERDRWQTPQNTKRAGRGIRSTGATKIKCLLPHGVKTKCITQDVQFSSGQSGVETLRWHCRVIVVEMCTRSKMLAEFCKQLALGRPSCRRI